MEKKAFRVIDTGCLPAADNIAWDQALLTACGEGKSVPTIRLLRFEPCVLIGRYQTVAQEIREEFCAAEGIAVNRRITGGGGLLFTPTQLGWEIIVHKDDLSVPNNIARRFEYFCRGCIAGLKNLGVNAEFRPMNDIEVAGRKISGTGGIDEGNAFFYQGTLLVDFDAETMVKSLRIPIEKLQDKEIESIKDRVTWLGKELGRVPGMDEIKKAMVAGCETAFGITAVPGQVSAYEQELFDAGRARFASAEWIHAVKRPDNEKEYLSSDLKAPGGLIRTRLFVDTRSRTISQAFITGDFFMDPPTAVYDLEALLKNHAADAERITATVDRFFNERGDAFLGIGTDHMATALNAASDKIRFLNYGFTLAEADRLAMVCAGPETVFGARRPYLLLPYCAKFTGCEMRYKKTCNRGCRSCTVGQGGAAGMLQGIGSETITSFEDLMVTLRRLKDEGYDAFIGCCCRAFLTKHRDDFEEAGLPGILMDINDRTCYDLGIQTDAYAGAFESQTSLEVGLLEKILALFTDVSA